MLNENQQRTKHVESFSAACLDPGSIPGISTQLTVNQIISKYFRLLILWFYYFFKIITVVKTGRTELIENYRQIVLAANKELIKKEAFKDLLNRLYGSDHEIQKLIDKITSGSETTILNIPRKENFHRGSADTLFNQIIIEFENDLGQTLPHAKEQLAGYLLGQFNSGEGYNFTLIATDCISWKVFAPRIDQLSTLETLQENELILQEIETASFRLSESNQDDFFFWIDRFLFREEKQRATLQRVEEAFGYRSPVFIESYRELDKQFRELKKYGEVQVAFEQWDKFLSIAYGSFDATEENFLIHTYLSIFSKILAYAVVSNDDFIDDNELKTIIDGQIFVKLNIQNFTDNDFFHWVGAPRNFSGLRKVFRLIAQEISAFDFENVDEDILKGVYQELIDLDTRHALGEYYTPDWLCERIVNEFSFTKTDKILDPACGSGSFLRAAIHQIRKLNPDVSLDELNNSIYGIDIHPLSVQIAKTTLLLAFGREIRNLKKSLHLNIILANALLAPEGVVNLFGGEFMMQIDREKLYLNTQIFEDVKLFDEALDLCEQLAEHSLNKPAESKETFERNLRRRYKNGGYNGQVIASFYLIYEKLKLIKEKGRDSIWKFIVQNLYKPYFLSRKFDYVIGNPPWFTFSSIKNAEYQNQLNALAVQYDLKPTRVANFPHLEIAAIFLAYSSSYFLKENGKISFVLPRSFFNADHHDNTRSGRAKGFKLTKIWDLADVHPLFRIPSCVFFGEKTEGNRQFPLSGVEGLITRGHLPAHNCSLESAAPALNEKNARWHFSKLGNSSALSTKKQKQVVNVNPYKKLFKQGATIVPRGFYFVDLNQDYPPDWDDRIIHIKTSDEVKSEAKKPWKGLEFSGSIESNFIFKTALSKSILPFALFRPNLVVLPILIENDPEKGRLLRVKSASEILREGYRDAAMWFTKAENIWQIHRTEKNRNFSSEYYLNWQNKLSDQKLDLPYIVLYNASAKDANATILSRSELDLSFIIESKAYGYSTKDKQEALYLSAILNSETPNLKIKDFQTRGLFGPRDIHKKILDVFFPRFDANNPSHTTLANLSQKAHEKADQFIKQLPVNETFEGTKLGRLRLDLKKHLGTELKEIDHFVRQIIS